MSTTKVIMVAALTVLVMNALGVSNLLGGVLGGLRTTTTG